MPISKCIVRLKDCHHTEHSVEVYAESLYEAVLRGLGRLQDVGWESTANETVKRVEVEIHQEPKVPNLLKRSSSEEKAWGSSGKDGRYLSKLRRLLGKSDEQDRKLILHMAKKMARR